MGIDLGKIMVTPKGDYQDYVEYDRLDLVAYQGSSYIALKPVEGITPSDDGEYWQLHGSGAYQCAKEAGYEGTEEEFRAAMAGVPELKSDLTKYLPLTGGTLSGSLFGVNNGTGLFFDNGSAMTVIAKDDSSNKREFRLRHRSDTSDVSKSLILRELANGAEKDYNLFGEHNKPSGSYTGNGSATKRTINIGGINNSGSMLAVCSPNGGRSGIISRMGGCFWTHTGLFVGHTKDECEFINGVLTIASDSNELNGNYVYYYQVL